MASEPWYQGGLAFSCVQCGNCCTGASGAVWANDEEIVAIASYLGVPVGEVRLLRTRFVGSRVSLTEHLNGDCTFFDMVQKGVRHRCAQHPSGRSGNGA